VINLAERKEHDKRLILAFVEYLRHHGHPTLEVERWPDCEPENRNREEIDAIAGRFAIEHTSVEVLKNQRGADQLFLRFFDGFENEVVPHLSCYLDIALDYYAIERCHDWESRREILKELIISECPGWPSGYKKVDQISGLPFGMIVWKRGHIEPGINISRMPRDDETMVARLRDLVVRKINKLKKYSNHTRLLLTENSDIALMNTGRLITALAQAFPNGLPNSVDAIWFANTSIPDKIEFEDLTSRGRE
jgi:hypothetical protein